MDILFFILLLLGILALVWYFLHRLSERIQYFFHSLLRISARDAIEEQPPRSLSGLEPTLLPLIRRDFPDFDPTLAKNRARGHLQKALGKKRGLQIHNVVIHNYLHDSVEKTLVYQAAVSWESGPRREQKRYDLYETYQLPQGEGAVAANCPNCGAALGFGAVECEYCGSRVVNPMGQQWKFTQLQES